ncbi:MAG TPA: HypC/HybG/HupF family hydrogenase formation chaperone [Desulfobacteraceae bacterium]|nr:HypC/HybG/HupF family hydrogenase formation chaperone [Desulfobacteraceae bacterium]
MCLAIPMRVKEIHGQADEPASFPVAMVDENGVRKSVRLDIVDRWPKVGDYLIVHAGFAIHTLDAEEAETNLKLMREMADHVAGQSF